MVLKMLILFLFCSIPEYVRAQVPSVSSLRDTPNGSERDDPRVAQVIERAENHFRQGKINLSNNHHKQARAEFDKAVETVLESGLDVRSSPRLRDYYLQLIERIYREEIPLPPGTKKPSPPEVKKQPSMGFREQKFEPSPLDELSKLVLEEESLSAPESATVCAPEKARVISLREFRLGMNLSEVKSRLPMLRLRPADKFGFSWGTVNLRQHKQRLRSDVLNGLHGAGFSFLDNRLIFVVISYDGAIRWDSHEEFASYVSTALGLPGEWSDTFFNGNREKMLTCGGVRINAGLRFMGANRYPVITLTDLTAVSLFNARKEAAVEAERKVEERKKRSFKP